MTADAPRGALAFILVTVTLDAMGIGLILPMMPTLLMEVNGSNLSNAAVWGGVLVTAFAVMQFLFGPVVGNLSDRFGRRPVLLISLAVMAADYLVMAVAHTVWLLLLLRIVGGIAASTHATAMAFIADISQEKDKAARFGLVGAAFGAGFVLGPLVGGLLGELGTRAPFQAAAALALANLALGVFVLPETVTDRIRRRFLWRRANPFGAFAQITTMPGLTRLVLIVFLYEFAMTVYPVTWAFFTAARFGWDTATIGVSLAVYGITMGLVQGLLTGPVLRRFGERLTIIGGFGIDVVAMLGMALVTSGAVGMGLTVVAALSAVVSPALTAAMSRVVPEDAQGELQGVIASARAVAMIFAPMVMAGTFAAFTAPDAPVFLPGAPFLVAMALMVVCGLVYVAGMRAPATAPE